MTLRQITTCLPSLLASAQAIALQPLVTDDTGTQGQGGKQIEAAFIHEHTRDSGQVDCFHNYPLVMTYGLTDELDIGASLSQQKVRRSTGGNESGANNVVVGAKYRFYENSAARFSLALKPEVYLPTSGHDEARGLGTARTSYAMALLGTHETGFGSVLATLAAARIRYRDALLDDSARNQQYLASVATLWRINEAWQAAGEFGGYTQEDRNLDQHSEFAQVAALWSPRDDLDVALGLKRDFDTGSAITWTTTLGITFRFK